MDGWLKNNGLVLLVYLVGSAIAYGELSSAIATVQKEVSSRGQYVTQFIEFKSEVVHLREEASRSRNVWNKLDGTLDTLNTTLMVQKGEIQALKEDVNEIKQAVVK